MRWLMMCGVALTVALAGMGCNSGGGQTGGGQAGGTTGGGGQTLVIKGSDTMLQLAQAWAEAFMKKNPGISVSVTGGGSGTGIKALINGTTQVANASREIEEKELQAAQAKGINPVQHAVARDALSIVVHKSNPVNELTLEQIKHLFTGKIANWNEIGGPDQKVLLLSRETSSGTYGYFKEHILDDENFVPTTLLMPSTKAISDAVSQDVGGIGYVGLGYVTEGVKTVNVKKDAGSPAVAPTMENVLNKSYPISRELYEYTHGQPAGNAQTWISFVLSPEGQQIVRQKDYVPIK